MLVTANAAPAYDRVSGAWPMVMAHVAMTVLIAFLLHGVHDGSFILFRTAAGELRSLCAWLWSVLFPRPGAEILKAGRRHLVSLIGRSAAHPRRGQSSHFTRLPRGLPQGGITCPRRSS
ncbi:hypothetical protein [Streptomyces sp. NPDC058424]|uniref:hypothetical protein n=1 Tax=Streptomyces sp. NPDC058424 TaxID=3346491 RepID=UPI003669CAA9